MLILVAFKCLLFSKFTIDDNCSYGCVVRWSNAIVNSSVKCIENIIKTIMIKYKIL